MRSKKGCITCKIRRVKCDEGKPHCQRCLSSGRTCDGYLSETTSMSRRQLAETARNLDTIGPISRAIAQRPKDLSGLLSPRDIIHFDSFRSTVVPGTCSLFPSSFWQQSVIQMAHSERAVWHAAVALGALHRSPEAMVGAREIKDGTHMNEALTHYETAIALRKDLNSPTVATSLSIALAAAANMLERWSEMHGHVMNGLRLATGNMAHTPSLQLLLGSLMRFDLQAMTYSVTQSPYPFEESSSLFTSAQFLAIPGIPGESYEALASELFGLGRTFFLLDDGTISDNAQHGPWLTSLNAFYRRLALWESKMARYEEMSGAMDNNCTPNLSIRLYHAVMRALIRGTSVGPEARFDPLLGYFEYAVRLATSLHQRKRATEEFELSLEPGLIIPLWMVCHRCRHPPLRHAALKLLSNIKRVEGMWGSDATAAVLKAVASLEEESLGGISVGDLTLAPLDSSSLTIPWSAWSRANFDVPSTLTWSGVPVIPEQGRAKEILGSKRVGERVVDLHLLMSSGIDEDPYGSVRELSVSY